MQAKDIKRPPGKGDPSRVPAGAFVTWLLMPVGFLSMATLCLWMGAPMSVRCERIASPTGDPADIARVSVTVERRFLALIPISKTILPNVTGVGSFQRPATQPREAMSRDISAVLTLRLGDGRTWNAPAAYAPLGTPPWKMGRHIAKFIEDPSAPPLNFWCVSWMLHLAAIPLLLGGLVSAYSGLRMARASA